MKLNETAEMDDTDPLLYTGPRVDPKTGKIVDKNGKEVDPNAPEDDDASHETKEVPPDELAASQQAKQLKVNEWVNVLRNDLDDVVGIDFGLTKEEGESYKTDQKGMQISDTYLSTNIGKIVENKERSMANKQVLSGELMEIGIKPKQKKLEEEPKKTSIKDFMNLGASQNIQEKIENKKKDHSSLEEKKEEVKEETESKKETPMKTYFKAQYTKKMW